MENNLNASTLRFFQWKIICHFDENCPSMIGTRTQAQTDSKRAKSKGAAARDAADNETGDTEAAASPTAARVSGLRAT